MSTVHTRHTTPPPHTLFAKIQRMRERQTCCGCTAGCLLSTHSTRHPLFVSYNPLHTLLYKDTICVHRGCERGRTCCGCTAGCPLSTHSTRHPLHTPFLQKFPGRSQRMRERQKYCWNTAGCALSTLSKRHPLFAPYNPLHTPLYKDTLGVHRGYGRGRTYSSCTAGCPHTAHDTPLCIYVLYTLPLTKTPIFINTLGVHSGFETDIAGAPQGVQHKTPFLPFLHTPHINTPLRPEQKDVIQAKHSAFLRLLKVRRIVRVLYCHSHIF